MKDLRDLIHGQLIRHIIDSNKIWIGIYDAYNDAIVYDKKMYSLKEFIIEHNRYEKTDKIYKYCEYEIENNVWISIDNLYKKVHV